MGAAAIPLGLPCPPLSTLPLPPAQGPQPSPLGTCCRGRRAGEGGPRPVPTWGWKAGRVVYVCANLGTSLMDSFPPFSLLHS